MSTSNDKQEFKNFLTPILDNLDERVAVLLVDCEVSCVYQPGNPPEVKVFHEALEENGLAITYLESAGVTDHEECSAVYLFSNSEESCEVVFLGSYHSTLGTAYLEWRFKS
jgi:hypothetical protein